MNSTYDHTNLKREINIEYKNGSKHKNVLTYNKKGQVIKGEFYIGSENELFLTSTYTYNSKGYLENVNRSILLLMRLLLLTNMNTMLKAVLLLSRNTKTVNSQLQKRES